MNNLDNGKIKTEKPSKHSSKALEDWVNNKFLHVSLPFDTSFH